MLETIINAGIIIPLFAIAMPFIFVLLVIKITAGSNKRHRRNKQHRHSEDVNNDDLKEIAKGLRDLNRRIDNLETLNRSKRDKER